MLGAIIGDIVGSVYEHYPIKTRDFPLFHRHAYTTDDTALTVAVGCACAYSDINNKEEFQGVLVAYMKAIGRMDIEAGFSKRTLEWIISDSTEPYNSYGNGSAMRVSTVGWVCDTLERTLELAEWSASVSHNHPEGIKGAQAIASCIFLARTGKNKAEIQQYIESNFYPLNFTLDEIKDNYKFDSTCQNSVPQGIKCFLEAESFEDAVRNAIYIGGDADTIGAMAGAIAEAYFGIPDQIIEEALTHMLPDMKGYLDLYTPKLYGKIF